MRIGSAEEIKKIDKSCIEEYGISSEVLMEHAALKIFNHLRLNINKSFTIVCGTGNNGGDGLVLARLLLANKNEINVYMLDSSRSLSKDCEKNLNILKKLGVQINLIKESNDLTYLKDSICHSDVVIDGIFGIGLSRVVEGMYRQVIETINKYSKNTISIDVPSGLNSDTGEVLGKCVRAQKTITFQLYKVGFLNYNSHKYTGRIIVEELNIPELIIEKNHKDIFMITKDLASRNIHVRDLYGHKGDFGKILIFAGSSGFSGASYICTEAAVKSGGGLVTLACHKDIKNILCEKLVEAMTVEYNSIQNYKKVLENCDVIAFGPGMGNNKETLELLKNLIINYNKPMIIDADGLNVLKNNLHLLQDAKNDIIITPHIGEMSRLTGYSIEYINNNRIKVAKEFAKKFNIIVLLKGFNTIITNGNKTYVNSTGNSSMASGGMGDCLTGIIASLVGQKISLINAAITGAFIHGYIGDKLSKEMYCVNATHIIERIPYILKELCYKVE